MLDDAQSAPAEQVNLRAESSNLPVPFGGAWPWRVARAQATAITGPVRANETVNEPLAKMKSYPDMSSMRIIHLAKGRNRAGAAVGHESCRVGFLLLG
jgi:hypothetical protein